MTRLFNGVRAALVGAAAASLCGIAAPAQASQVSLDPVPDTAAAPAAAEVQIFQYFQARHSGKDLAVLNASSSPNQQVVQFTRNNGHGQQWEVSNLPSPPSNVFAPDRQIRNRLSGLCLDVQNNSTAAGALIVQNPCNVNDPAQRWIITKVAQVFSQSGGYRRYVNKNSGLVMDIAGATTANNARLIQWPSHGGNNQLFQQVLADVTFD